MIGLEKVTGKIIADAEADARRMLDAADAECAAITARVDSELAGELERMREACDRECQALILRARSSAQMAKRNALLEARAAIVNEAYITAERQVRSMSGEAYIELLTKMLRTALKDRLESEADSLRLYGEDISPATYEVLFSERDRAAHGEAVLAAFRRGLGARFPRAALDKLVLSNDTAAIDGGLILRCGPVEVNCALSMLLAETRRETEVKVSRILFGSNDRGDVEGA